MVTLNNRRVFATQATLSVSNNVEGTRNIDSTPHRQVVKEPIKGSLKLNFYITDEFEDLNPMRIANCIAEDNIVRNHRFGSSFPVAVINEYEHSSIYPRGNYGEFFPNNQMLAGWDVRSSHPEVTIKVGLPEFDEGGAHYKGQGIHKTSALIISSNSTVDGAAEITQKDIFQPNSKYMVEVTAKGKFDERETKIRVKGAKEVGVLVSQYQTYLFEVEAVNDNLKIQFKGSDFFGQEVYVDSVKAYLKEEENFHDGFSGSIGALTFSDAYMTNFSFSARPFSPIMASASFDVYGPISGQPARNLFCKENTNFHDSGILGAADSSDIYDNDIAHGGTSSFYSITDIGITESLEFDYNLTINRSASHQIGDLFPRSVTRGSSDISMTLRGEGLSDALTFKGNDASIAITLFNMSGKRIQDPVEGALLDFDASRRGTPKRARRVPPSTGRLKRFRRYYTDPSTSKRTAQYSYIDAYSASVTNTGLTFKDDSCIFYGNDYLDIIDKAGEDWSYGEQTGDMTLECLFKIDPLHIPTDWVRVFGRGDTAHRTYGLWYNFQQQTFLFQQYSPSGTIEVYTNRHEFDISIDGMIKEDHIRTDTWYHLTATRNANQNNLFINGKLSGSEENNGWVPWNRYGAGNNLTIGDAGFHAGHVGEISLCRLYGRALSEREVRQNFTNFSCNGKIVSQEISVGVNDVLQGSITVKEKL